MKDLKFWVVTIASVEAHLPLLVEASANQKDPVLSLVLDLCCGSQDLAFLLPVWMERLMCSDLKFLQASTCILLLNVRSNAGSCATTTSTSEHPQSQCEGVRTD
jgi:hypothetical protein